MEWLKKTAWALGLVAVVGAALGVGKAGAGVPDLWLRAATDPTSRSEALSALEEERARGAYGDVAPLAASLLAEARSAPDSRTAEGLAALAASAAPADPRPQAFLARFHVFDAFQPSSALANAWQWIQAVSHDPWVQSVALLWVAAALTLSAWVAAAALVVNGLVAYGGVLVHDYRDSFPRGFRRQVPALLALLVCAVLWTVGTGPAVFLLLLGLALSPYLPRRGRWALGALLAVGCLLPQGLGGLAGLAGPAGDRAWGLYRVWRGDSGLTLGSELDRVFPDPDSRALFAMARVARREGNYERAEQCLTRALTRPGVPTWVLRTELGTLRFATGDEDGALEEFQLASEAEPTAALPWLGRHVVYLEQLELAQADEALDRARALGGKSIDRAQRRFTESSRHIAPIAPTMPSGWIRDEIFGGRQGVSVWVDTLVKGFFLPVGSVQPAAFALLGIGVVLAGGKPGTGRRSRRCPNCGFVVCPRCGRRVKGSDLCPACWANSHEEMTDSAERERQLRTAEKWNVSRERWQRLGAVSLPGWTAFLLTGRLRDLLVGLAWAGAVGVVALGTLYPIPLLPWGKATFPWGAVAVLVGTYAMGIRQVIKHPA